MKKILIFLLSLILVSALFIYITVFITGPSIPEGAERIIDEVVNSEPVDLIPGDTGYTDLSGVSIWYKSVRPEGASKGDILFVSGIAADSMWWPFYFVREFTDAGYRVILFDNRSSGMSEWMKNRPNWRYSLLDMADDGVAVLDKLKIREAHVIGVSMGGMIAQQMAISHPGRVRSIVSVMSSGNPDDPDLPRIPWKTVADVIRISCRYGIISSERNIIRLHLGIWQLFRNEALSQEDVSAIAKSVFFNIRRRRGYNPDALPRQLHAIISSGSRYEGLKNITMPALFIHGKKDPLIPVSHSVRCSQIVKGSSLMLVNGMGHDISRTHSELISERIKAFFVKEK